MAQIMLETIMEQALQLTPRERLKLAAQLVTSVETVLPSNEIAAAEQGQEDQPEGEHWGRNLLALLDTLERPDWGDDSEDVVAWVQRKRRQEEQRHDAYWKGEA